MTAEEIDARIAAALERVAERIEHEFAMDRSGMTTAGEWVPYALVQVAAELRDPPPPVEPDRGWSVYQPESRTENHLP